MNESSLLKLSLFFSILGIVILYFIANQIQISDTTIEKITKEEISGDVIISGKINEIYQGNPTIIKIIQENEIEVVVFDKIELEKGQYIKVIGETSEYKNKKNIIANKIEIS